MLFDHKLLFVKHDATGGKIGSSQNPKMLVVKGWTGHGFQPGTPANGRRGGTTAEEWGDGEQLRGLEEKVNVQKLVKQEEAKLRAGARFKDVGMLGWQQLLVAE